MDIIRTGVLIFTSLFVATGLLLISKFTLEKGNDIPLENNSKDSLSITFLLGEDKSGYNYFELAEQHFLYDTVEKSDIMIKSCRSIEDMILYLNNNYYPKPFNSVQVVLHGNPWNGLSLPIVNDGPRATPKKLVKAMVENKLPTLSSNSIDSTTRMNFWGCGIGKNPFIKIALEDFFTLPDGGTPEIFASPHFVIFKEPKDGTAPKRIKTTYWPYIFKRGYRPSPGLIAQEMDRQYPEVEKEWSEILVSNKENADENQFQNTFHIPVSWMVIYPSKKSRPSLSSQNDKMSWVKGQPELMEQIRELNIPMDKFTWTVNKIIHTNDDGTKVPAIKAIGMATVLCIMEAEEV